MHAGFPAPGNSNPFGAAPGSPLPPPRLPHGGDSGGDGGRTEPPASSTSAKRRSGGLIGALVGLSAGVVGGLVGVLVGVSIAGDDSSPGDTRPVSTQPVTTAPPRDPAVVATPVEALDVPALAEALRNSVVTVSVDLERLNMPGSASGSGVVVTSDGQILTNAHVVDGATAVRIRLAGETEPRPARILAADPGNDLALLQIDADGLEPATFADPASLRVGEGVVAIGFALGLDGGPSVTSGIISALNRTIITELGALDGLIQTDAPISSGNSGGPLVNAAGEVVGINTAVARGDAFTAANSISFAIGVGEVLRVLDQLRDAAAGTPRTEAYLGVGLGDRTDGGQGTVVTEVQPGSPAELAGIEVDDIVVAVDGAPIDGRAGLIAAIRDRSPGDIVEIEIVRSGELSKVSATLAEREGG
jgi:S1-C subfamily serine protease